MIEVLRNHITHRLGNDLVNLDKVLAALLGFAKFVAKDKSIIG